VLDSLDDLDGLDDLDLELAALPARAGRLVALVPAHNEEGSIDLAIGSLLMQSRRPDLIVVVADNCTDGTEDAVRASGAAVALPTVGNTAKKAGALNQALARILPVLDDDDSIFVMDADSSIDGGFLEAAEQRLGTAVGRGKHSGRIGGVGGTFRGGRGGGFVGMLQRNEYARYARDVRRLRGRVLVLTGTASLFAVGVLRAVVKARRTGTLPGGVAQVYDTNVLTEDNELTLALLHLGYHIVSPKECLLETEVMTDWRDLWNQRLRWKRGALENLVDYGFTRITWRYWGRQVLTHLGVLVTAVYLATVIGSLLLTGNIHLHPLWTAVTLVFAAERIVTVRDRGWKHMSFAALLVVEMSFDFFLQATQAKAFWDTVRRTERNW
jgi:cellulose synthase/poly-beta-1,6-N-acetylglucosamine synthase-like glycosyltransferase